ncbi:pseudouridine synthase [Thiomicrospira sp. WB1]|uniref:pseudouridine synthase n=1 Tax=Thiomicrospira sp. WB1 TaxID=1685380 RepID=UPI00074ACD3C|nr:pseudouridine synthase [Thiomicrospira sp. WB1]KUJ71148.1 pseudouridylate synthase [Thiomicrospira sp. WB1]
MHTVCQRQNLKILHNDAALVAIHKPAGLLVHRTHLDRETRDFALQMTRDAIGAPVWPVHRLDKATSGLLVFAKSPAIARALNQAFTSREVHKHYLAICRGWLAESGEIDRPLKADNASQPKPALTHYQTLATALVDHPMGRFEQQRYSLVSLTPVTGRKHQLRRHLNHIGHPIIGDVAHGDRHHNHFFYQWHGHHRLYLAATKLKLSHPETGQPLSLRSPLEPSFQSTLTTLDWRPLQPLPTSFFDQAW